MLSYDAISDQSYAIGLFKCYRACNNKVIYYTPGVKYDADDLSRMTKAQRKELLELQYGDKKMYRSDVQIENADIELSMVQAPYKGEMIPFQPQSKDNERVIYYIFGKSGSGKSYLAKKIAHLYNKMKVRTALITPVADPSYPGIHYDVNQLVDVAKGGSYEEKLTKYKEAKIKLKYKKRMLDLDADDLIHLEIEVEKLKPNPKEKNNNTFEFTKKYKSVISKPKLFIYDDTEAIADQKKTEFMKTSQLLTGRHNDIYQIVINHQANNGARTRDTINESNVFVFFKPWNRYTAYFCKVYLQLELKHIKKAKKLIQTSRFIAIYKEERVMMSQSAAYTFD